MTLTVEGLTLTLGPVQVRVESDHSRPIEALRLMFPEYAATLLDNSSTDAPLRVEQSSSGQYHIRIPSTWLGFATEDALLEWPDLVDRLEHIVAERLLWGQRDGVPLHAGGVNMGGVGILIVGQSGAGKSTLSVGLAQLGSAMLGDDVVIVGSGGRARPFHRRPKLDSDQARRMGIDPTSTVLWDAHADECWLDPSRWSGWSDPVAVGLVVEAMHVPTETTSIVAMPRAEVLTTIIGASFRKGGMASDPLPEALLELSARCRGARLRYSESTEGISAIRSYLTDPPGAFAATVV